MTAYSYTGTGGLGPLAGTGARVYRAKRVGSGSLGALGGSGTRKVRFVRRGSGGLGPLAGSAPGFHSVGSVPLARRAVAPADAVLPVIPSWPLKGPEEQTDYDLDWSPRLEPDDGIFWALWGGSAPPGISIDARFLVGNVLRLFLSGGTGAQDYELSVLVRTYFGRLLHQRVKLPVGPR